MKLPPYEDLSGDQDDAINLPLQGRFLIAGPPGSGKTVVALYRAQMVKKSRRRPVVMTFSRLLLQFMQPWTEDLLLDGSVTTFHSWLWSFYRANYRKRPPTLTKFGPDWQQVIKQFSDQPPTRALPDHLIVDEGQDLCREFYFATNQVCASITVLADENQRIVETQSTLRNIEAFARTTRTVHLKRNYRNTREIAAVAAHFYTGLRTGVPDLPDRSGPKPVLTAHAGRHDEADAIARFAASHADQSIGVLVPGIETRLRLAHLLQDAPGVRVQQYIGSQGADAEALDFSEPGITVATYRSAKGLEFDTVFLPCLDQVADEGESTMMTFYVLCSRPRRELFLSYAGQGSPAFAKALPRHLMDWRA